MDPNDQFPLEFGLGWKIQTTMVAECVGQGADWRPVMKVHHVAGYLHNEVGESPFGCNACDLPGEGLRHKDDCPIRVMNLRNGVPDMEEE